MANLSFSESLVSVLWFPHGVWELASRNAVSRPPSYAIEERAKRSFADGVPKLCLGTRSEEDHRKLKTEN